MPLDLSLQWALNASSAASLAVLLWEWAITLDTEIDFIWTKPNNSWLKWIFLLSRYFTITVSIISRYLEASINFYEPPKPHSGHDLLLRVWYVGQVVMAAVVVIVLEILLVARVYALYNQQRYIGIILLCSILTELVMAVVGLALNLPDSAFNRSLIISHLPASFAYFGICSIVVQIFVLILTIRKYTRSSLKTTLLVKLILRDGTMAFLMLTVFQITVVTYTLTNTAYAVTAYAWLLAASSCTTCRLVINMQTVGTISTPTTTRNTSTAIVFTTIYTDQIAYEDIRHSDSFQDDYI